MSPDPPESVERHISVWKIEKEEKIRNLGAGVLRKFGADFFCVFFFFLASIFWPAVKGGCGGYKTPKKAKRMTTKTHNTCILSVPSHLTGFYFIAC